MATLYTRFALPWALNTMENSNRSGATNGNVQLSIRIARITRTLELPELLHFFLQTISNIQILCFCRRQSLPKEKCLRFGHHLPNFADPPSMQHTILLDHLMFISLKPIIRFLEIPNNKPYTGLGCSNNRGIPWLCSTSKPRLHALRQATLQRRGGIRATGRGKGCAKLHQNT